MRSGNATGFLSTAICNTSANGSSSFEMQAKLALIFIAAFVLYLVSRSPALDEWDSVQFALGLREFNLWKHQPHPPGYPLYIFLGRVGTRWLGWSPEFALESVSCAGGALFVAAWFCIVRLQFGERFAWLLAGTLAVTPVVWMTATRALTDGLASGLLSAELYWSLRLRTRPSCKKLAAAALFAAAATGARPQLLPVALLILLAPLRGTSAKFWLTGGAIFIAGCLVWLLPTWYSQSALPGPVSGWRSYPAQLYSQWRWRFDHPGVFIGNEVSPTNIASRFAVHILGWFGIGLGLLWSPWVLVAGALLAACGLVLYVARFDARDGDFWKIHWSWAALLCAIVFCFLPGDQRYYMPIMPLLLVAVLRGLFQLPGALRFGALLLPAFLMSVSVPAAMESHHEPAPPIRLVQFLERRYPPEQRRNVVLLLSHCQRHFKWYAPDFTVYENTPLSAVPAEILAAAKAIYTDEPRQTRARGWQLVLDVEFSRSVVIYGKHHDVRLFRVQRINEP